MSLLKNALVANLIFFNLSSFAQRPQEPEYIQKLKVLIKGSYTPAQIAPYINYDEKQVPHYALPSITGKKCHTSAQWVQKRRSEVLTLLRNEMYGQMPPRPDQVTWELVAQKNDALDNTAIRKEIKLNFAMKNGKKHSLTLLMYIPKNAAKPVPAFLGLNFRGNKTTTTEADVRQTGGHSPDLSRFTPEIRKLQLEEWYFKEIIRRGYASVTLSRDEIFPDRVDGWGDSVLNLFADLKNFSGSHPHYTAIGAWAWGLSRALDYLEIEPLIDGSRVAVHGLSRLGKAALWAGANDQRFKMVISCCSGCGGAALSRRMYGEIFMIMGYQFKHWLISSFSKYYMNEDKMPFDQHFLLALIAPRALVINSATQDRWADPRGEFLSALHASEVYRLFGSKGLPVKQMPAPDQNVTGDISYHIHTGIHEQLPIDWEHYLDVADRYL